MVQIIGYVYKHNAWQEHLLYTKTYFTQHTVLHK